MAVGVSECWIHCKDIVILIAMTDALVAIAYRTIRTVVSAALRPRLRTPTPHVSTVTVESLEAGGTAQSVSVSGSRRPAGGRAHGTPS